MFLSNSTLGEVVRTQVKFKMNAYLGTLVSLVFVQLLGLVFSMNGTSSMSTNINNTDIQVVVVSTDTVFIFVAIWALFIGNVITTKGYRNSNLSFVTNSFSNNLSNIIVLIMMSVFAGVTTFLSNNILRTVLPLFNNVDYVKSVSIIDDPLGSIINMGLLICLILMISAGGYLWGTLVYMHKAYMFLLIVLIIATPTTKTGQMILQFIFVDNGSLLFLIVKLIGVSIVLFVLAIVCSNRLEVRR
ncbi:hypothetical protein [Psychrobacillus sp. OK032]|uniref:hypothetical protein n=1 Tax=Psychrobacillus sp. OK032 TaxID=1884358 RepID=UPI0008B20E15|nr:hypothetical protein [Psychrobacillus sp. OK032]SES36810.1 hypothetical protein SAMN05518872_1096 [Psychrobacillus sp. OK032]